MIRRLSMLRTVYQAARYTAGVAWWLASMTLVARGGEWAVVDDDPWETGRWVPWGEG